jgi:pyridoxal phosphate enzyme (YggS family)
MSLTNIQSHIARSAHAAGRLPSDIHLIAVSKMQPDERVDALLQQGHRVFGENRVQEALQRWTPRKKTHADLELHLIGPLQTNKVRDAVALFDVIHTLDRPKLVDALAAEMQKQGRFLPCLIQVNTGLEAQKSGVAPDDLGALLRYATATKVRVTGLMCIPPADQPPRPHFERLRQLAHDHSLSDLSMGMSADYETAIECGATYIRIGSALFGAR